MIFNQHFIAIDEYNKVRVTYIDNETEEFYIDPRKYEPSIGIDLQVRNELFKIRSKFKIKSIHVYTFRDGYETNTRVINVK